jgi:hypothetical protein
VLKSSGTGIADERSTRASPLTDTDARALLRAVDEVWIARGRGLDRRPAKRCRPADLRGPTGGYRAPIVRRGRTLLVGFHRAALDELLGGGATARAAAPEPS